MLTLLENTDLLCLDEDGRVRHVMALGRWMVQHGTPIRAGLFEVPTAPESPKETP